MVGGVERLSRVGGWSSFSSSRASGVDVEWCVWGCMDRYVVMDCVCFWGPWGVALEGGEYCFISSFSVFGWRQDTSKSELLGLSVLVLRDVGVLWFLRGGKGRVRVVRAGLGWGAEKRGVTT